MLKRGLRKELELLKSSCQGFRYWDTPPKERPYLIKYEEKERHCDNIVLQSLKEYDGICGQRIGKRICFQKHCDHKEANEGKVKEDQKIVKKQKEEHPFDLLIEALKMMISEENNKNIKKEKEEIEMDKLVPYSETDEDENDEMMSDTDDSIVLSEEEIEILKGQVPMYLLPAGYQFKNWE